MDQKIKAAYVAAIKDTKRIPSEAHIAEMCGTSQQTVSKHLTNINLDELVRPFKIFGNDVLMGLRNRASKGDAQAAKLFFALVYDRTEKYEVKGELKVKAEVKVMSMEETIKKYKKVLDKISEE